jgi:multicomponent Na+:H+ antiporter subunit F
MSPFLVASLLVVAILIAIGLYRVWAGPTVFDRLVAVALVSVNGVIVLVLLGITLERPTLFFDIALGFALLAFLLPITLGRYFEVRLARRDSGEDDRPIRTGTAHTVPHGLLADRGRALENRMGQRIRRQAAETREVSLARGVQEQRVADERRAAEQASGEHAAEPSRPDRDDAERAEADRDATDRDATDGQEGAR